MNLVQAEGLGIEGRLSETDLTLKQGEIACLVGPNGSGKTSLLHALAGIGAPSGTVRIAGEALHRVAIPRRKKLLAFLPATRDLVWPMLGRDLIALGLSASSGAAPEEIIRELDLEDLATRRVDRLSTGERSRILIARALAPEPHLLLLDEPTANLDPLWQLKLLEHLKLSCAARGQAILMALHDLDLAGRYADRLIVMNEGSIAADGAPDAIFAGEVIPQVFGVRRRDGVWAAA
ncbi:MAG TPA: ABC transporter ATP-binding protein [Allosphingosinicella sp.]|nr:ABC transporter ATP-binding protein [Allosphingosinicella sp.]